MLADKSFPQVGNFALVFAVVMLLGLLLASGWQYSSQGRRDRLENQVKSNLHDIQIHLERSAFDHNGWYPRYLIGGEPGKAGRQTASDILLREGYLDHYPRNPFEHRQYAGMDVLAVQQGLAHSHYGSDPLAPGCSEGDQYGYRFGSGGGLMGQVLCDARWPAWQHEDPATGELTEHHTWADVEYRFWDMWQSAKDSRPALPFSPGQFFYKGNGPVIARPQDFAGDSGAVIKPTVIDHYMLGGYGNLATKGLDVLGDEMPCNYFTAHGESFKFWMRTGSELCPTGRNGSPYAVHGGNMLQSGRPNGFRDGIILVLAAGED